MKTKISASLIAKVALLIALNVILTRVLTLVNSQYLKVGLGFLPVALGGMLFGPFWGFVCGALGDAIGAILFPTGDFFVGFSISAGLVGLFFGLLLRNRDISWKNVLPLVLLNCVGLSLFVNTFMISWLYGAPLKAMFVTRAAQTVVQAAAYCVFLPLLSRQLVPRLKKLRLA